MLPARIENPTTTLAKPSNWDEAALGHCGGLPIRLETIGGVRFLLSAWDVEPDEALHLAAGGKVVLGISVPQHPVVRLSVQPAPEQLTRTTLVRERINGRGEMIVDVETLFPPTPGVENACSNRARCEVLIGSDGAPRATALAMAEIEKLAITRGWIPA